MILSAKDSAGLETWLRQEKYNIPQGAAAALAPYIRDKSKFFVAKVDIKKVKRDAQGVVQLSPLRFYFDANELRLPVRLGLLNAGGKQDLIVYVIHPTRASRSRTTPTRSSRPTSRSPTACATTSRRSSPSCSTPPSRRWAARSSSPSTRGRRRGCDPCPTPPLSLDDLATLGLDVLEGIGVAAGPAPPPGTTKPSVAARERARAKPRPFFGSAPSWVLTRLHARYSKETLSEDLIFREAKPAMGGRANWNGTNGDEGASVSQTADGGINNFQGRYIIRHYWTGPVACENPRYDVWGGPPGNPFGGARADGGQGAGDGAAREDRAEDGGALAGAAARHRGQGAAATAAAAAKAK